MRMHFLPRCPEDHVAPRRLIASGQGQTLWSESHAELLGNMCSALQSAAHRSSVGQKGLWWLCNQLGFNRPSAQTESRSNVWQAIHFLHITHYLWPPNVVLVETTSMNLGKILFTAVWKQSRRPFCNPDISVSFYIEIQHQVTYLCSGEESKPSEKRTFGRFCEAERLRFFSIPIKLSQSGYMFKCRNEKWKQTAFLIVPQYRTELVDKSLRR